MKTDGVRRRNFRPRTCIECGATFVPDGTMVRHCDACRRKRRLEQKRRYNHKRMKNDASRKMAVFAEAYGMTKEEAAELTRRRDLHRCPYCGRLTRLAYCPKCIYTGGFRLHQSFGSTNGWDGGDRHVRAVRVESGWRGRPCNGGGLGKSVFVPMV